MADMEKDNVNLDTRNCAECGQEYVVGGGGQKGNSSPAVRIIETERGRVAVGYCSGRCLTKAQGGKFEQTLAYRTNFYWGVDLNEVSPPGCLAPARRVKIHYGDGT